MYGEAESSMRRLTEIAIIMVLIALVVPIALRLRKKWEETVNQNYSSNHFHQLSLAMLNYDQIHGRFPSYCSFDKEGKPLLSWRVHLLPFLWETELYNQFHLDEPWDSEHNKELITKMPPIYTRPGTSEMAKQGKTVYLVPVGKITAFPLSDKLFE